LKTIFKSGEIIASDAGLKKMSLSCLNTIGSVNARSKKTTTTSYTVTYSSSSLPFHYNYQNIFILSWVTSVLLFGSTSDLSIDISKLITSDTDFTIEMFLQVYTSTTATSTLMVLYPTSTAVSYTLGLSANSGALTFTDGSTTTTAGTSFSTKTWYHIAIVYSSSSSQYKIYANGTLHITFSKNASISYPQSLKIDVGSTTYFSNVRISTKALYTADFSSTLSFTDTTKFPYGSNLTWSSANNTVYLNTFDNNTVATIRASTSSTITSTTTTGTLDNTEVSSTVTYSSSSLVVMGATRTTSTDGTYTLFTFTTTGGYLVPAKQLVCNIFGVGGGGGGGSFGGGGGSGGGIIETSSTIDTGTYLVIIGGGGIGAYNSTGVTTAGTDGNATVLRCIAGTYSGNSYTYGYGGYGGAGYYNDGASYGGGGSALTSRVTGGISYSDRGIGSGGNGYSAKAGGGGGGSVITGQTTNNGTSATSTAGGNGGSGTLWTTYDSTSSVYYGGGGGGGGYVSGVSAGTAGGAGGAGGSSTGNGSGGTNGLGGGGGGAGTSKYGGNGGSGRLVMIFLTSDI
jgi:hypothetical protein